MSQLTVKQLGVVGLVALSLGILFDYLFFGKSVGISFALYTLLSIGSFYGLANIFRLQTNRQAFWYIIPALFFSGLVAVRANEFLTFWNVVLTFCLLLVFANHQMGQALPNYRTTDYLRTAVLVPFKFLLKAFVYLGQLLTIKKKLNGSQKNLQIFKGILITLPVVCLFLVLLASADLVFNKYVSGLLVFHLPVQNWVRWWWIIAVSFIWVGILTRLLENTSADTLPKNSETPHVYQFGKIEAGILFSALNLLFIIFVIIQIKYLFAGNQAITALGFTYAQYAHKGFFELLTVCVITFMLIFFAEKYMEKDPGGNPVIFKFSASLLLILSTIIIASAFQRLLLYENVYGFTFLRVLVQAFALWLGAVLFILLNKVLISSKESTFLFSIFVSVLLFFALFNIFNPDSFIARKNIERFAKTGKLDTGYLSHLSADAGPEIVKLLYLPGLKDKYVNELVTEAALIINTLKGRFENQENNWQAFNLSRSRILNFQTK